MALRYLDELSEKVKQAGIYLQENAEEIVGKLELRCDFEITLRFNEFNGIPYAVPEITITQTHLVQNKLR